MLNQKSPVHHGAFLEKMGEGFYFSDLKATNLRL